MTSRKDEKCFYLSMMWIINLQTPNKQEETLLGLIIHFLNFTNKSKNLQLCNIQIIGVKYSEKIQFNNDNISS